MADEMNWIAFPELTAPLSRQGQDPLPPGGQPCTVYPAPNGRVRVEFDEPQRVDPQPVAGDLRWRCGGGRRHHSGCRARFFPLDRSSAAEPAAAVFVCLLHHTSEVCMIYLGLFRQHPGGPRGTGTLEHGADLSREPQFNHPAGLAAREELARVTDRIAARLGVAPAELSYFRRQRGQQHRHQGHCPPAAMWGKHHLHPAGARACERLPHRPAGTGLRD